MSALKRIPWLGFSLLVVTVGVLVFTVFVTLRPVTLRRISATSCFQQDLPGIRAEMRIGNSNSLETEGIGPRSAGNSISLYCPIPSDSYLPHANIDSVVVHGWGSSLCNTPSSCVPFVVAYLCVSYESVANGICTPFRRSEVRGNNYEITFHNPSDFDLWRNNPNGYPYVRIELPPPSYNGDTSTVRGITVSGPSTSPWNPGEIRLAR